MLTEAVITDPAGRATRYSVCVHFKDLASFIRDFFKQHKPVAAICHGSWTLTEAAVVSDRRVTSWPSLKTDLKNASGNWIDEECVCDQGLVTSRNPDDLPALCEKAIEEFAEGKHAKQTA